MLSPPTGATTMATDLQAQLQATLDSEYRLERELGGGGMSRVFLAEERTLGRRVVVKVLNPQLAASLSGDRFEREIRVAAALQDPRIVPLIRAGRAGELRYYTMPFVDGETLRARMARGLIPAGEAVAILSDVMMALEYAHAREVVHRDIKPENVLLTGHTAVVTDFGIAKAIVAATRGDCGSTLTDLGMVIGTPAYMAPEQAAGDQVDPRTDLYAWGVMAYEMLTGAHPFARHLSAQALLGAQITESPEPLGRRRPELPPDLSGIVDRCLAKNAGERPASAGAVLRELGTIAAPLPVTGTRSGATWRGRGAGPRASWVGRLSLAAAALAVAGGGWWLWRRSETRDWARLGAMADATRLETAFRPLAATAVLERARRVLPGDTTLARAATALAPLRTIVTTPPGAGVRVRDYLAPDTAWVSLGKSPVTAPLTGSLLRIRLTAPGGRQVERAVELGDTSTFALDSSAAAPAGMVWVGASRSMHYVGFVGWMGPYRIPSFWLDQYEVTNRAWQVFVDSGGYRDRKYWEEPFVDSGRSLTWEAGMARLRDKSGRAGPSTWEGGHYPDGEADYPVSGISWYEAMAYARFAGKALPTLAQWYEAAPEKATSMIVQRSNISGQHLSRVGAYRGLGWYGTYDMAGNVREWTASATTDGGRFILGGAWSSPSYLAADPEVLSPFDRSPQNGVRCVIDRSPLPRAMTRSVRRETRDFASYRPAGDALFRAYAALYSYDPVVLDPVDAGVVDQTRDWRKVKVTYNAAYGSERITAYLFLPRRVRPPYQTVVFFPSARVLDLPDSRQLGDTSFFDYVVESGRAVIYPVYQDTYERRTRGSMPGETQALEVRVQQAKDVSRTLDYLATRPDIAHDKLAYLGVSAGAAYGVIFATLEQRRLKTAIFLDGGYFLYSPAPGEDQADFAPRLRIPVLMVNGRYDFTFPMVQAQDPLFRMLGTPAADKKHVVLDSPHDVRQDRQAL